MALEHEHVLVWAGRVEHLVFATFHWHQFDAAAVEDEAGLSQAEVVEGGVVVERAQTGERDRLHTEVGVFVKPGEGVLALLRDFLHEGIPKARATESFVRLSTET